MLPAQRNKVDISKLSPQEQQLFAKYGKLPTHKNVLMKMQKDRKYFDSGDYALSKAGKADQSSVGTAIPNPENIPHATPTNTPGTPGHPISVSPTNSMSKESALATDKNTTPPAQEDQEPILDAAGAATSRLASTTASDTTTSETVPLETPETISNATESSVAAKPVVVNATATAMDVV